MSSKPRPDLGPDLKERVLAATRQTPSGVRSDARGEARLIFGGAVASSLGLFFAIDGVTRSMARPPWLLATSVALWAAVATMAARGAWRYGGSFVAGSSMQLTTIAIGTPALLLAVSLALSRLSPGSVTPIAGTGGLPCIALTFAAAAYPLAGLIVFRRSTDPLHPIASGAALGAAAGAAAGVMVEAWCPVTEILHVISAHVLPVATLAALGGILGDRVLAMRVSGLSAARHPPRTTKFEWLRNRLLRATYPRGGGREAPGCLRSTGGAGVGGASRGGHHDP
jgi:hypothetical protein